MAVEFRCLKDKVQLVFEGKVFHEAGRRVKLQLSGKDFLPKFQGTKIEDIPEDISFYIDDLPGELSFLSAIVLDNLGSSFSITLMVCPINRDSWVRGYSFSEYLLKIEEILDCCVPPIKSYKKSDWDGLPYDHSILGVGFKLGCGDLAGYVMACAQKLSIALGDADKALMGNQVVEGAEIRAGREFCENIDSGLEEDQFTEFKEIISGSPEKVIRQAMGKYILSFLNAEGGSIYWGIDDSGVVKGVKLTSRQKDKINQALVAEVHNIEPAIDPTKVKIYYHEVKGDEGGYVVEVYVSKPRLSLVYFNKAGDAWVRVEGCSKKLKGMALQEFILEKQKVVRKKK